MSYVWKGLKQPDNPYPARGWCEPGRHNRSPDLYQDGAWECSRCGARGWYPGYPKTPASKD